MPRSTKVLLLILSWFAAELIVLSLLVKTIGWVGVIALGIFTTGLGLVLIRKLGRHAVRTLQAGLQAPGAAGVDVLGGSLRAVAAIFLIVPGFITDFLGLLMLFPGLSGAISRRFSPRPVRRDGTIDLDRDEWRSVQPDPASRLDPPDRTA